MYLVLFHIVSQQNYSSTTLLLHWFFCLRRPELQFWEEGQLDYTHLCLLLHVKPLGELGGRE